MYDRNVIQQAFIGRVGFRQNVNPNFPQLADSLLYTGSNVLLNHPLINIENLDMCARDYSAYTYPAWSAITTYAKNDRVTSGGNVYMSSQDGNLNHVVTNTSYWQIVNQLSDFLLDFYQVAVEDLFKETFQRKKLNKQTKTLIKNIRLYDSPGSISDLTVKGGNFVGVEIKLKYAHNLIAVIDRIGLQLSQIQPDPGLKLYLFHSSQLDAIATVNIVHNKESSFVWHTAPATFVLHYMNPAYESGGVFYLMYDEDQLVGQAVQKRMNFLASPGVCGYCNPAELQMFGLYSKFLMVRSVRVNAVDRNQDNATKLWDIRKNIYVFDNNFGINLEVTVKCDLTDFILQQKEVFDYALRDMLTVKLLEMMAGSTRQNSLQEKIQVKARAELTAPIAGGMGIQKKLNDSIDAVDFEVSELDNTCMPCNAKSGLSYGTIY